MKKKQNIVRFSILGLLCIVLFSGCSLFNSSPNTVATVPAFQPLTPPAIEYYPISELYQQSIGGNETANMISSFLDVSYGSDSGGIGGVGSEKAILPQLQGRTAVSQFITWGDIRNGRISRKEYYSSTGELLSGVVVLDIPSGNLFQWLTGNFGETFDRSQLLLVYQAPEAGSLPVLTKIVFDVQFGTGPNEKLPWGDVATWSTNLSSILPASYQQWGFWESAESPFEMVKTALNSVESNLNSSKMNPDLFLDHNIGLGELIGRHSGLVYKRNGVEVGKLEVVYDNVFGTTPNTKDWGSGSLSKVYWTIDGQQYALYIITPKGAQVASSLYIFSNNPSATEAALNNKTQFKDWSNIYVALRNNTLPGAFLGIFETGKLAVNSTTGSGDNGGTPTTVSVTVGTSGGFAYSSIGKPTHAEAVLAKDLMNMLGLPGVKALGFYYASSPESGSGIEYYISALEIMTADPKDALNTTPTDVGEFDRVGLPSTEPLPTVSGQ